MAAKIKVTKEQQDIINCLSAKFIYNKKTYYKLPFWYVIEDGELSIIRPENLPQEVKDLAKNKL